MSVPSVTCGSRSFTRYAWLALAWNAAVILWGAVVRATGAGAGCGGHWPLCNGAVIPPDPAVKTLIEYGHRLTSGLALLLVVGLVIFAFRAFPKGHVVRRAAAFSLGFELSEALIGAGLVLLGHVAANQSVQRGYSLTLHLTNTLLLVAALALTAWFSIPEGDNRTLPLALGRNLRPLLILAAAGILLIGISGVIAALGDTLFAASSLSEGLRQDFAASSHPFVRLRIFHPMLAVVLGSYVLVIAIYVLAWLQATGVVRKLALTLIAVTFLQICLGTVNLVLMAPVPIQIAHLFLADLLWVTFVLFAVELWKAPRKSGQLDRTALVGGRAAEA